MLIGIKIVNAYWMGGVFTTCCSKWCVCQVLGQGLDSAGGKIACFKVIFRDFF